MESVRAMCLPTSPVPMITTFMAARV
jgi:hypothetical protein